MACGNLWVLMWKHLMVRKKKFIQTPLEFICPTLFFILLYSLKNSINPPKPSFDMGNGTIAQTEVLPLSSFTPPSVIYYHPDTAHAEMLMEAVGESFGYSRLVHPPPASDKWITGYYAIQNQSSLAYYAQHLRVEDAIVILQNMQGPDWPKRLNYTIRMKSYMYTSSIEPMDEQHVPHMSYGTVYEPFMRLQWALDTSYIKLFTGNEIPQRIWVQEFPYYKTSEPNLTVLVICAVLSPICWLSPLLGFVLLSSRLLTERTSGIQELIKMVGVSPTTLAFSHFLNVLPGAFIFALAGGILLTVSPNPLIPLTNGVFIAVILFLYYISIVSMAFACSYIARSTHYSVSISMMAYLVLWMPMRLLVDRTKPRSLLPLVGLLPHMPLNWFWDQLGSLESYGNKVSFETMFESHEKQSLPVFWCYILLIVQTFLFFMITWYLSHVRPGKYGQAKPWNFLLKKEHWHKPNNEVQPKSSAAMDEEQPIARDMRYFEEPPKNMNVGIKIQNVSKMYGNNKVLDNVSLDVYKDEITVLLGHNGAGKTTLMSIITGLTSPSDGKVFVNGMDTRTQMVEVRRQLGLCPQHNLFFADLTVLEHVMFFTLLKKGSYKEAKKSSRDLLDSLGLGLKLSSLAGQLSGGMQRRLQLACSLAGGASVLVLDEPTSGLDVETRRQLWDLLLSLRGSRTVLLTTHFMEEADALGDRVAALHGGLLRSYATPMFLKKAIGTGYRLTFTTNGPPNEAAITSTVTADVPNATVKETTMNSISYNLPGTNTTNFPHLFSTLEAKRKDLGIATIGVGVSTLEEVFLRLCSDVDTSYSEDSADNVAREPVFTRATGFPLFKQQLLVLLKRQYKFFLFKKISFFFLQFLVPILMICLFVHTSSNDKDSPEGSNLVALDLGLYSSMPSRRVLYSAPSALTGFVKQFPDVEFETTPNVAEAVLRSGKKSLLDYNKYIAGIEINETDAKVLYTTTVRHAAPVALGLLSNALAASYVPWSDGRTLAAHNAPYDVPVDLKRPKDAIYVFLWATCISFIFLATLVNVAELPCSDRILGARHTHILAGAGPGTVWAAALAVHAGLCAAVLVLATLAACAALDPDHTLDQPLFLVTIGVSMLLASLAFLAAIYQISFYLSERGTAIAAVVALLVFVFITPPIQFASKTFSGEDSPKGVSGFIADLSWYLILPHTCTITLMQAGSVAVTNAYCDMNKAQCPDLLVPIDNFDVEKCCANENPACYFCFEKYSPAWGMLMMTIQFLVIMTTVILTQYGVFNGLYDYVRNTKYIPKRKATQEAGIRAEADYVNQQIKLPKKQISDVMLANDLHKNYRPLIGKPCNAVSGISFSVKKGECFGLLGVNGAGKSTVFKMITAEECTTRGSLFANGYHLKENKTQYLRSLSYCPQFSGSDPFLTGRENLALILTLRGLRPRDIRQEVDSWIRVVGLDKYADRAVSEYSGGCSRRLAAACALCAGAPLTLLDEPTAGVDVAARRRVWAALRRALASRAVVITSHSMDEMEALCGRMCMVAGGAVAALGAAPELRARHAAGHAVLLKVRPPHAGTDAVDGEAQLEKLRSQLHENFDCTLKDEHKTMLRYHINQTLPYSQLFEVLEKLKSTYPNLIEDYAITETTLEEVFLSFAEKKYQNV